jgi:putative endonuclease
MAKHILQGKQAEEIAANYLIKNNYQLLDKNYRRGKSEVDLIVKKADFIIFVEVKSLKNKNGIHPEQQVNKEKINMVHAAANVYQYENNWRRNIQFDIIAITFFTKHFEIEHFKDAF